MYAAQQGRNPTNLYDQSFPYEGLITAMYAGRNIKIVNVTPFSFCTDTVNGITQLTQQAQSCYMCFISGIGTATAEFSVAGKDTVQSLLADLSGKMIIFDQLLVQQAAADVPFQLWGWKIDIQGSITSVPTMAVNNLPGHTITLMLDGVPFNASTIANVNPVTSPWYRKEDNLFQMMQLNSDGTLQNIYTFSFVLPHLGGGAVTDDYVLSANSNWSNVNLVGSDWIGEVVSVGAVNSDRTITIESNVQNQNIFAYNGAGITDSDTVAISNITADTAGVVGFVFPINSGIWAVGGFSLGAAVDNVHVTCTGASGTRVRYKPNGGAFVDQAYVGAGIYTFVGVDTQNSGASIIVE